LWRTATAAGIGTIIIAPQWTSLPLFILSQAIVGCGFGFGWLRGLAMINKHAPAVSAAAN
jgi:hypothetical protein